VVDGSSGNFGWLLKGIENQGGGTVRRFESRQNSNNGTGSTVDAPPPPNDRLHARARAVGARDRARSGTSRRTSSRFSGTKMNKILAIVLTHHRADCTRARRRTDQPAHHSTDVARPPSSAG
jgi:hypothetical protein